MSHHHIHNRQRGAAVNRTTSPLEGGSSISATPYSAPSAVSSAPLNTVASALGNLDPTGDLTKFLQGKLDPTEFSGPDGQVKLLNLQHAANTFEEACSALSNGEAANHNTSKGIIENLRG